MSNNCTNITFNMIQRYPKHYMTELVYNQCTNFFLLYQYGPYLIMNTDTRNLRDERDRLKIDYFHTPILRFMLDIGTLVKIKRGIVANMKGDIEGVINQLPLDDYGYAKITRKIANDMLKELRRYQYEHKVLEGAMIDYCPIVPYSGTIVKPEMTQNPLDIITNHSITDNDINKYLETYIVEIMQNPTLFLSIDTHPEQFDLKEGEYKQKLSPDILKLCEEENNPVRTYFLMVYLKYCIPQEEYATTIESLFNLNDIYNKIVKGEMVNVSEAIAQLTDIDLPHR